jgi:general stress protein 26
MTENLQGAEALKKMKELADSVGICMLTTTDSNGEMAARPMGTQQIDEDGTYWFFTLDTSFGAQSADGDAVLLAYASPAKNSYLTVNGLATLVHDKAKMKELWKDILKAWFPQGLETPDIALLRVKPIAAHYWDSDASRMRILAQWAVAKVTGKYESMEGKEGELTP